MTSKKDYYDILRVSKTASADEIKSAYRKLAMKYHPDQNQGNKEAEESFKEVAEAYEVLSNAEKKSMYDRFGHDGLRGGGMGGGFHDPFDLFREVFGGGFGSIFEDFFGTRTSQSRRSNQRRGTDLQIKLKLSLEEIASGVTKQVKIKKQVSCDGCDGSGLKSGSEPATCPQCQGNGEVREVSQSLFGRFVNITSCSRCGGRGTIITNPCEKCRGEGIIHGDDMVEINVPAGVADGRVDTAARDAIAQGDVAHTIHRYAAHPTMVPVGSVGALLVNGPAATGVAQFEPAHTSMIGAIRVDCEVANQRLVIAKVTILEAVHQAISNGIQPS